MAKKKKFEVTLYYQTKCSIVVEAEDEFEAKEEAYCQADKYQDELMMSLQTNADPDVCELDED